MAETKGFEPSGRFPAHSLSRGAPSTARPRLQQHLYKAVGNINKTEKTPTNNLTDKKPNSPNSPRNQNRWLMQKTAPTRIIYSIYQTLHSQKTL